jgi:protein-L-isoaspartate(D-aspartate) O-methyltransferase
MDLINQAFKSVQRVDFVPDNLKDQASIDAPLPIGFGQTISQPTTVRLMMEWLGVQPGEKVLDIGAGSGWTTALLSSMVGRKGKVFAIERIPELVQFGRDNCNRAGLRNVSFFRLVKAMVCSSIRHMIVY